MRIIFLIFICACSAGTVNAQTKKSELDILRGTWLLDSVRITLQNHATVIHDVEKTSETLPDLCAVEMEITDEKSILYLENGTAIAIDLSSASPGEFQVNIAGLLTTYTWECNGNVLILEELTSGSTKGNKRYYYTIDK